MELNELSWKGLLTFGIVAIAPGAWAQGNVPGDINRVDAPTTSEAKSLDKSQTETEKAPSSVIQIPTSSHYYSPYAFVVDKKVRTLSVWQQTDAGVKRIAQFPADMGKKDGEKRNRGDFKTPEGIYFLQEKLEGTSLDFNLYGKRAFTTDYPNFFDRRDGKTGNGIWLHAVPDTVPLTRGSKGCVVVRNNVILDLTQYIRLGRTPIIIKDRDDLLSADEARRQTSELNQWLEEWRTAWEKKDLENYIAKYGEEFQWMKMNRAQYRDFKASLNEKYKTIAVKISRPLIFAYKTSAVVRFLQEYTSDQHIDFGEKVLYLRKSKEGYRIVGETWAAESSQLAKEEIENTGSAATALGTCSEPGECNRAAASTNIN